MSFEEWWKNSDYAYKTPKDIMEIAWNAGQQDQREKDARIAEDMEYKRWNTIGDPRIPEFKPWIAKAIRSQDD